MGCVILLHQRYAAAVCLVCWRRLPAIPLVIVWSPFLNALI